MPRKRMIDPSFWRDEKIGQCTPTERLLFIGLWTYAEDTGAGRANPILLRADIFPYDSLSEAALEQALEKLAELGLILLYEAGRQRYYFVTNFKKHQTINKPTPPTLPLPTEHAGSPPVVLPTEEKIKEDKLSLSKKKHVAAAEKTEIALPLEDGTEFEVTESAALEWEGLYPSVDVRQELRGMRGWLLANPSRRKTRGGILHFITSWLSREQEGGGAKPGARTKRYRTSAESQALIKNAAPTKAEVAQLEKFLDKLKEE